MWRRRSVISMTGRGQAGSEQDNLRHIEYVESEWDKFQEKKR